ncbi:universal stress protein UspD [Shigella flexneri]|nr:universal stress protein UspD [Shigella flexneri]
MAYKHIGVAISGNEEDALLVNKALELARHNDAHLTLIHIDDGLSELYPGIYFPATEDILQLLKNKSDNKLYKLTKNIQWPKTKLRIERGEMPETLLEIMQKEQCDLLVCGHHHSFINRLMPAYRGMINKMSAVCSSCRLSISNRLPVMLRCHMARSAT